MDDMIEALQIFKKYNNSYAPFNCSHDELWVDVSPDGVSKEDLKRLDELGFFPDEYEEGFKSYRFGSC